MEIVYGAGGFVAGVAFAFLADAVWRRYNPPPALNAGICERVDVLTRSDAPLRLQLVNAAGQAGRVELAPRRAIEIAATLLSGAAQRL